MAAEYLNHNIASSLALYTYLARSIDRCKGETAMEFFMSSLNKLVPRVCSYIEVVVQGTVQLGTSSIVINREG